jgi:RNA polymerase sigma-70 factor (sigma-E family)
MRSPSSDAVADVTSVYLAHRLALVRLAALLVDDLHLAEDVVQEAFIAVHRRADRIRDPEATLAYLRTSVVNTARTTIRKRMTARRYLHAGLAPDEPPADTEAMLDADHREVLAALRRLPDRQREVLTLRYWSGLSEAQIAEALGISRGAVKSNASRGIARLEAILGGMR